MTWSEDISRARQAGQGQNLDMRALLGQSWRLFMRAPRFFVLSGALVLLGGVLSCGLLLPPLTVGLVRSVAGMNVGQQPQIDSFLRHAWRRAPAALLVCSIIALATALGAILVVVPGLAMLLLLCMAPVVVAMQEEDGWAGTLDRSLRALRLAATIAAAHVSDMLLLAVLVLAVNLLGTLVLVGLIVSVPFSAVIMTLAFRSWQSRHGE